MHSHNYVIKKEPLGDKIENLLPPLLEEHWEEVALNKQLMVLKPDLEKYAKLEELGLIIALFAYADNKIAGYSVNIIVNNMHYSDLIMCQNDVIFVSKEHRTSSLGIRLIKETEKYARELGAEMMLWHAKEHSNFSKLLRKKNYNIQDIIYSKNL